jgi:hypothetical protein
VLHEEQHLRLAVVVHEGLHVADIFAETHMRFHQHNLIFKSGHIPNITPVSYKSSTELQRLFVE